MEGISTTKESIAIKIKSAVKMEVNEYTKETYEINDHAMAKWSGCYKKKADKCENVDN